MNTRIVSATCSIIVLFSFFVSAQTVIEDRIALTVIDSPWVIMMDSKDFVVRNQTIKPDGKSVYLLLSNRENGLNVSLFIEPAIKCKTSEECRDFVLNTGNPAWGKFQDLVKSKLGDVSYFEFFRPTVQDKPIRIFDMYAEFVENGYWVDLHISKANYKNEDHKLFENVVKSIRFVSKTAKATTKVDQLIEAARKSTDDWIVLWDAGKHGESYSRLSSYTKGVYDEKSWFSHWTKTRKPLGNLKSRKLFGLQLYKSIPGIPERSGAGLIYQSSFENKEKIYETFSVSLEKDGVWKVAYYATNEK